MIFIKLRAGALQLTLFIIVVIALLLASFLLLVNAHKQFQIQTDHVIEVIENSNSGIDYALQHPVLARDTLQMDISDDDYKTLKLYKTYWGVFEKITASSKIKHRMFQKTALIGAVQPEQERTALYVEDHNKPLVLVGNTTIRGVAYLPERGVRPGTISGHSYYGSQLIYGNTKNGKDFPELPLETQYQLAHIFDDTLIEDHRFIDLNQSDAFENSFLQPYQLVYSQNTIVLSHKTLTGHIIVRSQSEIIIENSCILKDVILIAPKITVQDGVKGVFQAFATDTIEVGSNCHLDYPSALVVTVDGVHPEMQPDHQAQELISPIHIQPDSVVKGVVVFTTKQTTKTYEPHIVIDENATVYGEVYCNANLELKGTVYGTVFTSNFIAKQFGSVYQNHLYNATIVIDSLQPQYAGLTFKDSKKDIIKWLY